MGLCCCFHYPLRVFVLLWTTVTLILKPKSKIPQPPEWPLKFFFGPDRLAIMEFLSDVYSCYGLFTYEKTIYIVEPSLARQAMEVLDRPPSIFAKKDDADMTHDPDAMTREFLSEANLESKKRDAIVAVVEKTMDLMERSDACNVSELILKMVLDIHGQILLGVDLGALDDKQEKFIDALVTMIRGTFMEHKFSPKSQEFLSAIGTLGRTLSEQLQRSLNDPKSAPSLASHLKPCGTEVTMGKLQGLFAAGNLTTASNLSLLLDMVARRPKIQEELQQEVDETINDLRSNGYRSSPKLESAMKECLRFHPPASAVLCRAKDDATVGHVTIPAGSNVQVFLWGLERSCRWTEKAKEIRFDRFLDTATSSHNASQSECFMPFGAGARTCTGKNIVWLELKLALSLLLNRFHFSLVAQTKEPKYLVDWAHGAVVHESDVVLCVKRR